MHRVPRRASASWSLASSARRWSVPYGTTWNTRVATIPRARKQHGRKVISRLVGPGVQKDKHTQNECLLSLFWLAGAGAPPAQRAAAAARLCAPRHCAAPPECWFKKGRGTGQLSLTRPYYRVSCSTFLLLRRFNLLLELLCNVINFY